jgi:hypothetical protein
MPAGQPAPPVGNQRAESTEAQKSIPRTDVAHHAAELHKYLYCFEWFSRPGPEAVDCEFGLASWIDVNE